MKIAILGFAGQGQSAYEYWNTPGNDITVCDKDAKTKVPAGAQAKLGNDYLKNLDQFDLLIRTPALHPRDIVSANSEDILSKVWTNTNEFFKVCPSRNIIGVTGTKGKGTTSTLIAKMLEAAGHTVHLGGNIGIPPLDLLKNNIRPDDWVVLELANFQLIDLRNSPHIGVCLMVVPEHLDWHEDTEEYIAAKQQMFMNQTAQDIAIYYSKNENSESIAGASEGTQIPYYSAPGAIIENDDIVIGNQSICSTTEVKLLGEHNWQNICAAVTAVWQIDQNVEAMHQVITSFEGLEHRLEFVKEVSGVSYYDDSFGTAPETAIVAIKAFDQPKVVILGGSDKGANYDDLAKAIMENNVRGVVTIGETGTAIAKSLRSRGFTEIHEGGKTMAEIVNTAKKLAQPGDVVLLSTACASFGLFQNYKDRGEQFKKAVLALS